MKDRVVGYVRVSTQGQVKDGYSLAYQTEEIQRYCVRHNLELLDIYKDEGISGAKVDEDELTIEREGLQEMLSDLKWRDVKHIVVLNTSRLWRVDIVKVLIQRELKRHQVDVKAIEQSQYSIYAHDPNDFLVNGMMELLDQYQRLEIALKLSRGRRKKAAMRVVEWHLAIQHPKDKRRSLLTLSRLKRCVSCSRLRPSIRLGHCLKSRQN